MVKRRISVDFTLKGLLPFQDAGGGRKVYWAPVAHLRKWPPLMKLDLRDEDGSPLPLLTTSKNRAVDAAALCAAGKLILDDEALLRQLWDDLAAVPKSNGIEATNALGRVSLALEAHALALADAEARKRFIRDKANRLVDLAGVLATSSIFWARVEAKDGDRKIIKFAFEQPVHDELIFRRRLLSRFSWGATAALYPIPHVGSAGIYHCQLDPPEEMQIKSANLVLVPPPVVGDADTASEADDDRDEQRGRFRRLGHFAATAAREVRGAAVQRREELFGSSDPAPEAPEEPEEGKPYVLLGRRRTHLYVSGPRQSFGLVSFRMAVADRGLTTAALTTSLVIAVLLTVSALNAPGLVAHIGQTVTLLILVPGLLGFLVIRPNEHVLLTRQLSGVRALGLASGALPLIAALILIGQRHPTSETVAPWWGMLALIAWLLTALLTLSWLLPAGPGTVPADQPAAEESQV